MDSDKIFEERDEQPHVSLPDIVASVASEERTLICYTSPATASLVEEVSAYLTSQNVSVRHEAVKPGTDERAVLKDDDSVIAEVTLDALRALVDPGVTRQLGESVPYSQLLEGLSDTTFTSYDRHQMLTASREIEDRAWRQGHGTLSAGFQRLSVFMDQQDVYDRLGESDLAVHVYGEPDVKEPTGPYQIHATRAAGIPRSWFVVYDGGGHDLQKCALLAEERTNGFYGFWTYDPSLVDTILDALPETPAATTNR